MVNKFSKEYEKEVEPVNTKSWAISLIEDLKSMSLANIRYYQKEMGFYGGLKERSSNHITKAHIDIILHMTRYKIEENHEDIIKYRGWETEISGI
jgi:competence protein ComGF